MKMKFRCVGCNRVFEIHVSNPQYYIRNKEVIERNWVCMDCSLSMKRIKRKVRCSDCGRDFIFHFVPPVKSEYKFYCPHCCSSNCLNVANCRRCYKSVGVCFYPYINCDYSRDFSLFEVPSKGKYFVITSVDYSRRDDDFHFFKYIMLYNGYKYKLAEDVIIMRKDTRKVEVYTVSGKILASMSRDREWISKTRKVLKEKGVIFHGQGQKEER